MVVLGTDDWEYQWEDEEVTEDIRIPSASLNGDFDDDDDEESAKSSLLNGGQVTQSNFKTQTTMDLNNGLV